MRTTWQREFAAEQALLRASQPHRLWWSAAGPPATCANGLRASHATLLIPAGIKARTKETRLAVADVAVAGVAGACAGGSTELNPWDSPISQLRLVTGAGAGPRSSVRTRCKGETRVTDLIQSQSSLDAGTAVD